MSITKEQLGGIVRHLLNTALAYVVANGAMTGDGMLVAGGSAVGILGIIGWSMWSKTTKEAE